MNGFVTLSINDYIKIYLMCLTTDHVLSTSHMYTKLSACLYYNHPPQRHHLPFGLSAAHNMHLQT